MGQIEGHQRLSLSKLQFRIILSQVTSLVWHYNKSNMWFRGLLDCLCVRDRANRKFTGYNPVPVIPPEVIEWEILPRLPVKSLVRFKSVCKSWNLLIRNPDFIRKHHHVRNLNEEVLMIWSRFKNKPDNSHPKLTTIIGSINGLVCFSNCYAHDNSKPIEILIWNPATEKCLKIPPFPDESAARYFYDFFGFGYDSIANDFKVMYATRLEHNEQQPLLGYVYSCSSGSWRKILPSNFLYNDNLVKNYCQFAKIINGSPYWWVQADQSLSIISFDVRQDIFRLLPDLGFIENITEKAFVMMNLRDSLVVMFCDIASKPSFFSEQVDVYVFNEKCSIWNKKSIGPIMMIEELTNPCRLHYLVFCFINGDILLVSDDFKLTCVNLENNTINDLKCLGKEGYLCLSPCYGGYAYSESLVFIEGMESSIDKDDYQGIFFLSPFAPNLIRQESRPERNREIDEAIETAEKDMDTDEDEAHED